MAVSDAPQLPSLDWDVWGTRFFFFTGKGGVGKTTVATAAAVRLADLGHCVLLVSTDPASNLADVLQAPTDSHHPAAVAGVESLDVLDVDPQVAADAYRERVLAPYRDTVPKQQLAEFARLLTDQELRDRYAYVIFDTAPTGHTLRLLSLPAAWTAYLAEAPGDTTCLGPLADLDTERRVYQAAVDALADPSLTTFVAVASCRPL